MTADDRLSREILVFSVTDWQTPVRCHHADFLVTEHMHPVPTPVLDHFLLHNERLSVPEGIADADKNNNKMHGVSLSKPTGRHAGRPYQAGSVPCLGACAIPDSTCKNMLNNADAHANDGMLAHRRALLRPRRSSHSRSNSLFAAASSNAFFSLSWTGGATSRTGVSLR